MDRNPNFHFKKETKITCGDKSVAREKTWEERNMELSSILKYFFNDNLQMFWVQ